MQTEDGKIVAVQHPSKENTEVVNFKKNIAAAFQANFKGTADEVEEDTMSLHHSHYRFVQYGTTFPMEKKKQTEGKLKCYAKSPIVQVCAS